MTATSRQREALEATQTYCPTCAFPSGVPLKGPQVEGEQFFLGFLSPPSLRRLCFHHKIFLVKKEKKRKQTTITYSMQMLCQILTSATLVFIFLEFEQLSMEQLHFCKPKAGGPS